MAAGSRRGKGSTRSSDIRPTRLSHTAPGAYRAHTAGGRHTMTPDETRTVPRGRHRKPRHRRALLAAGALTLTAGAATLIHLSTPDAPPRDTRAATLPSPERSGAATTPGEADPPGGTTPPQAPRPNPNPTSPKAQGGKAQEPLTQQSAPPQTPSAPASTRTVTPPPAPETSPTSELPPQQPPTPPPPATTPPPPPPPPGDESKEEDDDRGLCLPLLNICLGG